MTIIEMSPVERHTAPNDVYIRPALTRGELRLASQAIDVAIGHLHETFPPHADQELFERDARRFQYVMEATDAFLAMNKYSRVSDHVAYHGLMARRALAFESVVLPTLYSQTEVDDILTDVLDGTSGKTVTLLDDALKRYDDTRPSLAKLELSGAIGELHFLSMANFAEDGEISAVPAPLNEDLLNRTDAYVFHKTLKSTYRSSVQVKSNAEDKAAVDGIGINGKDMSNLSGDGFPVSRALVRLYSGDTLTPQESDILEQAKQHFNDVIRQKLAITPGKQLSK